MKDETIQAYVTIAALLGALALILIAVLTGCTLKKATIEDLEIKPPYKEQPGQPPPPPKPRKL